MLEVLKAIVFGLVEGITEWLPISSTGHMIILNSIWPLNVSEDFYDMFEVVIQLGAIIAVIVVFWKKIWPFGKKDNNAPLTQTGFGAYVKKDIFSLWFHILVSCIPAAVVGVIMDDWIDAHLYNSFVVAIMLILIGIVFIIVEVFHDNSNAKMNAVSEITYTTALLIGLFQVVAAILPGTSRSGATIIGALLLGVARTAAAEYTFYLAIPVMIGASLLKVVKFIASGTDITSMEIGILILGCVVAFGVSMLVINFLMSYIKKHDFKAFGYYRIVIGIVVLVLGLNGIIAC